MDPLQYQEILDYSQQNSKLQVSVNSSGNVVMVPVRQLEDDSPTESLSQHVTTHIITPEQLQQVSVTDAPSHYRPNQTSGASGDPLYDTLGLCGVDENLADLQPEDSDDEEEEGRPDLSPDQRKLEFMAAVNLVPPAVLEEIQRRQKLCRAEYGNWWDRQHSTDFCLVPKTSSALSNIHTVNEDQPVDEGFQENYPLIVGSEDVTQVAGGPDAESTVEQITYLTSWPATSSPAQSNTVEVVTTPTTAGLLTGSGHAHQLQHVGSSVGEDGSYQITFQSLNEYSSQQH